VAGIIVLIRYIVRKNTSNISENTPAVKRQFGFVIRLINPKASFQTKI